jgi:hypothetical protein
MGRMGLLLPKPGDKSKTSGNLPASPTFRKNRHPFVIGVAGGTASGKTTVSLSVIMKVTCCVEPGFTEVEGLGTTVR